MRKKYDETGRWYEVEKDTWYPSVTTMLGATQDMSGLDVWRARVGERQADKICKQAADIGTSFHDCMESFLLKRPYTIPNIFVNKLVSQAKKVIDKRVGMVYYTEKEMKSDALQLAGMVDAVVEWDGETVVLDWKNSRIPKKKEWLEGYKLQCTIYALMYYELTGIKISKGVLVFGYREEMFGEAIEFKVKDYFNKVLERVQMFKELMK